jgi:hypothetical protein
MKTAALLLLLTLGCAHETTQQKEYRAALEQWVGKDINLALEMMGPPTETFQMPNGRTIYTWVVASSWNGGGTRRIRGAAHGDEFVATRECRTSFTATPAGLVDAIRSEGRCGVGK